MATDGGHEARERLEQTPATALIATPTVEYARSLTPSALIHAAQAIADTPSGDLRRRWWRSLHRFRSAMWEEATLTRHSHFRTQCGVASALVASELQFAVIDDELSLHVLRQSELDDEHFLGRFLPELLSYESADLGPAIASLNDIAASLSDDLAHSRYTVRQRNAIVNNRRICGTEFTETDITKLPALEIPIWAADDDAKRQSAYLLYLILNCRAAVIGEAMSSRRRRNVR